MNKRAISKPSDHNKWLPIIYATYYQTLKKIAESHGYALAIHGSLINDMDLVAVPWVDTAGDPMDMLADMGKAIGRGFVDENPYDSKAVKPHRRTAYTFISGGGGYFDISIMDRQS